MSLDVVIVQHNKMKNIAVFRVDEDDEELKTEDEVRRR